jgi:hypothetical protein
MNMRAFCCAPNLPISMKGMSLPDLRPHKKNANNGLLHFKLFKERVVRMLSKSCWRACDKEIACEL